MGTGRGHVHPVRTKSLVSDAEVEEMKDFFKGLNLHVDKILDGVHIKLVPFKSKTLLRVAFQVEDHLRFLSFKTFPVEQIENLLVVELKERDGD